MKRIKKQQRASDSEKTKEPKWWIALIVAPIIVGLVLWIVPKLSEEKYGELRIACNVDSAEVFLNKDQKGFTQAATAMPFVSLQPGVYVLSVAKKGFVAVDTSVKIVAGEITSVKVDLRLAQAPAESLAVAPKSAADSATTKPAGVIKSYQITITLHSKPRGAKILIDGKPAANASNTIWLPKGQYRLRIENETYYYEEMLQVPSRKLVNVTEDDIKKINQ